MSIQVPMRFDDQPLLWTVDAVYSAKECQQMISLIQNSSPELATNNPIYRNQHRVIIDSPALARQLFQRLKSSLPATMGSLHLHALNDRLRFYHYSKGQYFRPHMDHWYRPSPRQITLLSVLVYFNGDFHGGETEFLEQHQQIIVPRPGLAAIFQHKIRHQGCEVLEGHKFAMRTDVIYEQR